jgi:histidine decarboxylase
VECLNANNTKKVEVHVLDYFARLWNIKSPHDPSDGESYWGYLLSMGSTEGNLYGLWQAREYLQGTVACNRGREVVNE